MTSLLAPPLVIVKSTEPCNGECGGEVTLYTDLNRSAYAVTNTFGDSKFLSGDSTLIERKANGDHEVSCQSVDLGDQTCDGMVTFAHTDLTQHSEWLDPEPYLLDYMQPMDRE